MSIAALFANLKQLIGNKFIDAGADQERSRGAVIHNQSCAALGYSSFLDNGQFPDIRHQLLEVKLQTSPTIDLGVALPNSDEPVDIPQIQGIQIRHCDVRYAVFYASIVEKEVTITNLIMTNGESFFSRFPQFQGKVTNAKLQISLPSDFFLT